MASQVTITAKSGPDQTVTAGVFTNVTDIYYDLANLVVWFTSNGLKKQFELSSVDTVTTTISGSNWTIVIS